MSARRASTWLRRSLLSVASMFFLGCGGGGPLLHPARTLARGDVRAGGGLSTELSPGSFRDDLERARQLAGVLEPDGAGSRSPETNEALAKGALVAASVAPGIAPFVGARVGLAHAFEAGLAYTGRGLRGDVRRAFSEGPYSLSLGLGLSTALYGRQSSTGGASLPGVDLGSLRGYGADMPVLIGWQSPDDIYAVWFGPRAGLEWVTIEALTSEPKAVRLGTDPLALDALRWHLGAVAGLSIGNHRLRVALETHVAYQSVAGSFDGTRVRINGLTLTPASALWLSF
jgi:hypothetical protein